MSENFAARVKKRLQHLLEVPNDHLGYNPTVRSALLQHARAALREAAMRNKNADRIIRDELGSNRIELLVQQILLKLHLLGYSYENETELVQKCVRFAIDYLVRNYPCHVQWMPVRFGFFRPDTADAGWVEEIRRIDDQIGLTDYNFPPPWDEIEYAVQNALVSWTGESWSITPAGKMLLRLSIPTATVYLLSLEVFFNGDESRVPANTSPSHMSKRFLKEILDRGRVTVDIGDGEYSLSDFDPNMDYLNRLGSFELLESRDRTEERRPDQSGEVIYIADEFFEVTLTQYGKSIVESVVSDANSTVALVVSHLATRELTGGKYLAFTKSEGVDQLDCLRRELSQVTGDQEEPITRILEAVREGRADISTLRALPPTIERVTKNVLIAENHLSSAEESRKTLGPCIRILEKLADRGNSPFQRETVHYIDSIQRNAVVHGNITPTDVFLDALLNLMLGTLLKMYQDYANYLNAPAKPR